MMVVPLQVVLLLGAGQGVVLGVLLAGKRGGNSCANRILAAVLGLISLSILLHVFSHAGLLPLGEAHKSLITVLALLVAPLVRWYGLALARPGFRLQRRMLASLAPCALALLVILLAALGVLPAAPAAALVTLLGFLGVAAFIGLAQLDLYRHARRLRDHFSTLEKINLRWLRLFLFGLTLFWGTAGVFDLFFRALSWDIVWLVSCAVIYLIGYFGFVQPDVFSAAPAAVDDRASRKYEKSALTDELADAYLKKLQELMRERRLFLERDLSLATLAQIAGLSPHHLSQVLNERLGRNFYDYINSQRIAEAERLLAAADAPEQNIAAVAFAVGFNTLSAFNAAFRKFNGQTPSRYRRTCRS